MKASLQVKLIQMARTRVHVFLQSHFIRMMAIFPTYENNSFKLDVVREPAMKRQPIIQP